MSGEDYLEIQLSMFLPYKEIFKSRLSRKRQMLKGPKAATK